MIWYQFVHALCGMHGDIAAHAVTVLQLNEDSTKSYKWSTATV